jgi:hypothetical protein
MKAFLLTAMLPLLFATQAPAQYGAERFSALVGPRPRQVGRLRRRQIELWCAERTWQPRRSRYGGLSASPAHARLGGGGAEAAPPQTKIFKRQ